MKKYISILAFFLIATSVFSQKEVYKGKTKTVTLELEKVFDETGEETGKTKQVLYVRENVTLKAIARFYPDCDTQAESKAISVADTVPIEYDECGNAVKTKKRQ